ncbi:hypothetical protein AB0C61_12735 [Streptomyces sp. NPDC048680]|uniref:hypothetical protein n=1 Tax=Streptomyces sp. NPDC048680 TaxID=3155492 RepID=UPI00342C8610
MFGSTLLVTAIDVAELELRYWVVSGAAPRWAYGAGGPPSGAAGNKVSGLALLGFAAGPAVEST